MHTSVIWFKDLDKSKGTLCILYKLMCIKELKNGWSFLLCILLSLIHGFPFASSICLSNNSFVHLKKLACFTNKPWLSPIKARWIKHLADENCWICQNYPWFASCEGFFCILISLHFSHSNNLCIRSWDRESWHMHSGRNWKLSDILPRSPELWLH